MSGVPERLRWILLFETAVLLLLFWVAFAGRSAPTASRRAAAGGTADTAPAAPITLDVGVEPTSPAAGRQPIEAPSPGPCLLFGMLTDAAGQAIPDATLHVLHVDESLRRFAAVDPRGSYAVFGLRPGEHRAEADADGFHAWQGTLQIGEQGLRHDLVLRRAVVLRVRARTPDGRALEAALNEPPFFGGNTLTAVALHEPIAELPPSLRSSPRVGLGKWRPSRLLREPELPADLLGTLELQVEPPVHVCLLVRQHPLGHQLVPPGTHEVRFELDPAELQRSQFASLRLRVADAQSGLPIPGPVVALANDSAGGLRIPAGDGGSHACAGIAPGLWQLEVSAPQRAMHRDLIRLEPGQALDLGEIRLHPPCTVAGAIVDTAGNPARTTLKVDSLAARRFAQELQDGSYAVDEQGRFRLDLGPGRHLLRAQTEHSFAHAVVDTASPPELVRLRLGPAVQVAIENRVAPHEYFLVVVRTAADVPLWAQEIGAAHTPRMLLPHGDYVVEIYRGTAPVRSFALHVGAEPLTIRVP